MKNIFTYFLLFFSFNSFGQTHSDLYITVDSIIKNVLKYNSRVKNVSRFDYIYIDSTRKLRRGEESMVSKWTHPVIYLNEKLVFLDELECIMKSEIDSLNVLNISTSQAIFGSKGINGAIIILSKVDFSKRLLEINSKTLNFIVDSVEVSIDKSVKDKYFWKELIKSDSYFLDEIIPSRNSRMRRVGIYSCTPISSNEFEMRIASSYVFTIKELKKENFRQLQGLPPIPPKHKIRLNSSKTYFYKIEKAQCCEI